MAPAPAHRGGLDLGVLWRAALLQAALVAALALALVAALPDSFFEDWGWLSGPLAWLGCAALTARLLKLPVLAVLVGAVLAGVASTIAVLVDAHWLGVGIAIGLFGFACAHLAARRGPRGGSAPSERAAA
jgi:hypothetical protein